MDAPTNARHSAVVRMELHVAGQIVRIAQSGREFVIARTGINCPPCKGEFHLWIDGEHEMDHVYLPNGMVEGYVQTRVELDKDFIALPESKAA